MGLLTKYAVDFAPGIPDPQRFGDAREIPPGKLLQYVVQRHLAERAGPHYDVRFGERGPASRLMSFATKKELPLPGEKRMLFQQPLHRGQYAQFEGEITSGYGKGTVKKHDSGSVIVTKAEPNKIQFIVSHKKYPEYYTMIRQSGPPTNPTSRQRQTQGGSWLMINTTPMNAAKFLGGKPEEVGLSKLRYTSVPAEKVDKLFDPNYMVQEKVDGASALYHLLADRIEAVSYRVSKDGGRPIIHTHRVFGPGGSKTGVKVPPELVGSIVRGEIYGERGGAAIPPQELGGILNASVQRSLEKQREQKVQLKNMLFDVVREGKTPIPAQSLTPQERMTKLKTISALLPKNQFRLPDTANTPEEARALYEKIISGKHPRTREGIVAWPMEAGRPPRKVKPRGEHDVWIKSLFPGEGKLKDVAAGGFEYSLSPEGPAVGRVGTGFTEGTRREMIDDPTTWLGRMARITAKEKATSGAYIAPSFVSRHEDYPLSS